MEKLCTQKVESGEHKDRYYSYPWHLQQFYVSLDQKGHIWLQKTTKSRYKDTKNSTVVDFVLTAICVLQAEPAFAYKKLGDATLWRCKKYCSVQSIKRYLQVIKHVKDR